jgi:predicted GH43/DUF377 family glycosyl hydrolase
VPPGGGGELFLRAVGNPLLTARRWPDPVNAVLNPGAALVGGVTVLLCRVEDRRGISELTVARSADGVSNWVADRTPLLSPSAGHPQEAWGMEDPRITRVDELDRWVIAYTAHGPQGPAVALATTRDFTSVQRLGVVRAPEDKNAALLPRRVGGDFILFHRPVSVLGGRPGVWLSRSTDLHGWAAPEPVFGPRPGWWDSARVGIGPPPIETPEGWLGSTTVSGTRSPARCTGSGWCCWTWTTPPSCGPEHRNGCWALPNSTNGPATSPALSFPAA